MKKVIVIVTVSAVLVAVLLVVGVAFALGGFGNTAKMISVVWSNRSEGLLRVGDRAPDLILADLDGTRQPISSYYKDKPLVLSFGSYT